MYSPPLTVAVLTYNRVQYLKESLAGIFNQTYKDFEILILDNHSSDDTAEYVLSLKDPRIRYIRNSKYFSSIEFNFISAFHLALGEKVLVTHDDDVMEPDMLEKQMKVFEQNREVKLVWVKVSDIDQDGYAVGDKDSSESFVRIFKPGDFIDSFLREKIWPMPSGVMFDKAFIPDRFSMDAFFRKKTYSRTQKELLESAGSADVVIPALINTTQSIAYISESLLKRRVHTNQFTHSANISLPSVHLYRALESISSSASRKKHNTFHFQGFINRYLIQDEITSTKTSVSAELEKKINYIIHECVGGFPQTHDAFIALLPVYLLASIITKNVHSAILDKISVDNYDLASKKFLHWAKRKVSFNSNIMSRFSGGKVYLFGSAFVSSLLILEAAEADVEIVACVDSNLGRQSKTLLNVKIESPEWFGLNVRDGDTIIITSEGSNEAMVTSVICNYCNKNINMVSWKELV